MFGWLMDLLGFGGVKVMIWKFKKLSKSDPVMEGAVLFKTKKDKQVLQLELKVIEEWTTTEGSGDEKTTDTETTVLGTFRFPERNPGVGYPLDLKPGVDVEQPFGFDVAVNERLQNYGAKKGLVSGLMSLGSSSSEKIEYYLVATATVKGSMDSTAREKLEIED